MESPASSLIRRSGISCFVFLPLWPWVNFSLSVPPAPWILRWIWYWDYLRRFMLLLNEIIHTHIFHSIWALLRATRLAFSNYWIITADLQGMAVSCAASFCTHLCCLLLFLCGGKAFFFFFFFFAYGHTHDMWKFLGQGLNLSCSYNLCHSCSNARFLTHSVLDQRWTPTSTATQATAVGSLTYCTTAGTPTRLIFGFVTGEQESPFKSRNSVYVCYPDLTLNWGFFHPCPVSSVHTRTEIPSPSSPCFCMRRKLLSISFTDCLDCEKHTVFWVTDHLRVGRRAQWVCLMDHLAAGPYSVMLDFLSIRLAKDQESAEKGFQQRTFCCWASFAEKPQLCLQF